MNHLMRGAIAGAAGVALLLGGAGSFALWNNTVGVDSGTSITAGHLNLSAGPTTWYLGDTASGTPINIADTRIVPGDVVSYRTTANVDAAGDSLRYTVSVDATAFDITGFEDYLTHSYTVNGEPSGTVFDASHPGDHEVVGVIAFDEATPDQVGFGQTADLGDLAITVNQTLAS